MSATNVTIFAPSNDAFTKFLATPGASQMAQNSTLVTAILQYHVIAGMMMGRDFSTTPKFASSLLGPPFANVTGNQKAELVLVNGMPMIFSGFKQGSMVVQAVSFFLNTV
jgi:uncharacterized surface protein with fasciclin (FAS1) repeats